MGKVRVTLVDERGSSTVGIVESSADLKVLKGIAKNKLRVKQAAFTRHATAEIIAHGSVLENGETLLVSDVAGAKPKAGVAVQKGTAECYFPPMERELCELVSVPFDDIECALGPVMAQYGVAIVTNILSEEECVALEQLMAQDVLEIVDMDAAQQCGGGVAAEALRLGREGSVLQLPVATSVMLGDKERCQLRGHPHGRFAWAARRNERVRRVYEVLHGTAALVSSCDNTFFAPGLAKERDKNPSWGHVDYNSNDSTGEVQADWEVYQGLLYVWPSISTHASTTVVWPGSHKETYQQLMEDPKMIAKGSKGNHFCPVYAMKDGAAKDAVCGGWHEHGRRATVPAGGLLLWNSRTVHQGWSGGPRLAQPLCWEPVDRRDERARDRKLRMAALGLPSTHWASLGCPHYLVSHDLPEATEAKDNHLDGNQVRLPLKPTLHPQPVRDGVEIELETRKALAAWDVPLSAELSEWLRETIKPEFKEIL